ncbi:hypothetical protein [Arthrobacter sp. Edens01]|uniref:hypothetical protein n=1 Tax=Arthrobacter sp. Edens01 TaxID=1732020 RepID=UPI00128ED4C0|nr:hypothetical protein [Arthrobacter sp. Edens01]
MGGSEPVSFDSFQVIYGSDPLYHWVGLDTEMMYAAHKAAGGMTSIYRQLGIGCERLFREVIKDTLSLSEEQVKWRYQVPIDDTDRLKTLTLDGRIELTDVVDDDQRNRISAWIDHQRARLNITQELKGVVFEVRQGYKSADSKRQNGDLSNSAQALGRGYIMGLVLMSTQMNRAVRARYELANIPVLLGTSGDEDNATSTFAFFRDVIGYDLGDFFERNSDSMRAEVIQILEELLSA